MYAKYRGAIGVSITVALIMIIVLGFIFYRMVLRDNDTHPTTRNTTAPVTYDTFVYCSETSPEGFNPQFYRTGSTFDASAEPLYNRLVAFTPGTTEVTSSLAESWTVSDDGLIYTFHLRDNIPFHSNAYFSPTRPLTADDVLFTFYRQWDPNHPYHYISGGDYAYFGDMGMGGLLKDIRKLDDLTVAFELNAPNAPFLSNLAMSWASIFSAEYAEAMLAANTPERVDTAPIGTGPFTLVNYQQDALIRYAAFPEYWQGVTPIPHLVFSITPDPSVRYAKLRAGECHLMPYPNPTDIPAIEQDPSLILQNKATATVAYLSLNVMHPPLDNLNVRKALSMAIDRQAIIDSVYHQTGTVANSLIPPSVWSHDPNVGDSFDLEEAQRLLNEAGFPDGFQTDLWAMPVQRPYMPNGRLTAELIQADWAALGVQANIVSYEWGEYLNRLGQQQGPTSIMGWTTDNGDPDNFLYTLTSCEAMVNGSNYAGWCDEDYDEIILEAQRNSDQATRIQLYKQAQQILSDNTNFIPLGYAVVYEPMRSNVRHYTISPVGLHNFYGVELVEQD